MRDVLHGRAFHTERNPRRRVLPAAGADVRCRIMRQENDFRTARLNVSVACEAVEWNGVWAPFAAVPDNGEDLSDYLTSPKRVEIVMTRRRGYASRMPTFVFHMDEPKSEGGPLTLGWITTVPPKTAGR